MENKSQQNRAWGKFTLPETENLSWFFGTHHLYVKKDHRECKIALEKNDNDKTDANDDKNNSQTLKEYDWKSYIIDTEDISVLPALPDRPIIVKLSCPVKLAPRMSFDLYIPVPLWIQIYQGEERNKQLLLNEPLTTLSDTWFGEVDKGELSYDLEVEIIREINQEDDTLVPVIFCPIHITNQSTLMLDIQNIFFQVPYLSVYSFGNKLTGTKTYMNFKGTDPVSNITFEEDHPGTDYMLLNEPREPGIGNLFRRGFSFIKSLT